MKKEFTIYCRDNSLLAIEEFSKILMRTQEGGCATEKYSVLQKEIGIIIGKVQVGILEAVYSEYPDLDDLK